MVEDCQNVEPEKKFVNNLLSLAKEMEMLTRTRQFKKEFENEKSNFPFNKLEYEVEMESSEQKSDQNDSNNECLKMEVYDDKDYDIEEIKFWNFISKNKGVKPSVIRTIVYKVPESSYIVKKVPVIIDEPEEKVTTDKDKKDQKQPLPSKNTTENVDQNKHKENKISESESSVKIEKAAPVVLSTVKKSTVQNQVKTNEPVKFSSEDIIVIDEDDDIIGFEDENDEKEEKKESIKSEEICQEDENNQMEEDDDDDIIEEDVIQKQEQDGKSTETIENNEDENNEETNTEISVDKKLGLLQKSIQIKKRHRRSKAILNRPKVVIEKANEPASTISVKKSSESDAKTLTRSRVNSSNLNKTLPVITEPKAPNTRKSLNLRTDSKKSATQSDMVNSVSSSSSNVSTTSTSVLNNSSNEPSRVTRSKAKLKDSSK